jgi:dipeptidase E
LVKQISRKATFWYNNFNMKLLLTSGGLTNKSIEKALFELVGKKPEDTILCFIPTAATWEMGDKDWFINDLINIQKRGFNAVSIVDISALPEDRWKPQIDEADILFFSGGYTYHLMDWINKSGLIKLLPEYMKTKVWVGISAGSMVTNPDLSAKISQAVYGEDFDKSYEVEGLNYVDFNFLPHLNSPHFPNLVEEKIKKLAETTSRKIYALDDQSALKVVDGEVEVITEGKYLKFN